MADSEDSFHSVYYDAPAMIFSQSQQPEPKPASVSMDVNDATQAATTTASREAMAVPSPQSPTSAPSPLLTTHRIIDGGRQAGDDSFSKGPWNASAGGGGGAPLALGANAGCNNENSGAGSPVPQNAGASTRSPNVNAGNVLDAGVLAGASGDPGTTADAPADIKVVVIHDKDNAQAADGPDKDKSKLEGAQPHTHFFYFILIETFA
jgi:hypothetical protein